MRTHVIKDRYCLFSTVELYDGDTRVAITTCRPGNERQTAERLKAQHHHRKIPSTDPVDNATKTKPHRKKRHTK